MKEAYDNQCFIDDLLSTTNGSDRTKILNEMFHAFIEKISYGVKGQTVFGCEIVHVDESYGDEECVRKVVRIPSSSMFYEVLIYIDSFGGDVLCQRISRVRAKERVVYEFV